MMLSRVRDLQTIPIEAPEGEPGWILWSQVAGPYLLRVVADDTGDRIGYIYVAGAPCTDQRSAMWFPTSSFALGVRIPADAPPAGPGLLEAVYQGLEQSHEMTELRLRPDRDPAELAAVMKAGEVLTLAKGITTGFGPLACCYNPRIPIARCSGLNALEDFLKPILADIGRWYGAFSHSLRLTESSSVGYYALYHAERPQEPLTAHDVLAATAVMTAFYAKAAGDLCLDEGAVAERFSTLGIDAERPS